MAQLDMKHKTHSHHIDGISNYFPEANRPEFSLDLLLKPGVVYSCGDLLYPSNEQGTSYIQRLDHQVKTPIKSVKIKKRILACAYLQRPALDPTDFSQIREVLRSCSEFDFSSYTRIGEQFGVCGQRVRQIIAKALRRLRLKYRKAGINVGHTNIKYCFEYPDLFSHFFEIADNKF